MDIYRTYIRSMKNPFITALEKKLKQAVGRLCESSYAVYCEEMHAHDFDPMDYTEFLKRIKVSAEDIDNA